MFIMNKKNSTDEDGEVQSGASNIVKAGTLVAYFVALRAIFVGIQIAKFNAEEL